MTEHDILGRVRSLVGQEHELRARRAAGEIDQGQEQSELKVLEEALDQSGTCCGNAAPRRSSVPTPRAPQPAR